MEIIRENPSLIKQYSNPDDYLQTCALFYDSSLIEFVNSDNTELYNMVIEKPFYRKMYDDIYSNMSVDGNLFYKPLCGKEHFKCVSFMKNKHPAFYVNLIRKYPDVIVYIDEPFLELYITAIYLKPSLLKNIFEKCKNKRDYELFKNSYKKYLEKL